ncbi:MAG: chromosomal replication initiator protein DnaA [Candidatus Omnitrophica bacterium]|nr:chromosomal replication initiator protein DnaA [Candidatus Omnitrophota bacterium]
MDKKPSFLLIWDQVKERLKERYKEPIFSTWFAPLKPKEYSNNIFLLEVPDNFFGEWLQTHYLKDLEQIIKEVVQAPLQLRFEVAKEESLHSTTQIEPTVRKYSDTGNDSLLLNSRYTFENFIVGPSNRHAHAYSLAVAETPGKLYNPLFIYGGVGLGKTHLVQAICHHILKKFPHLKIRYMPSERFTNELIDAITHKATASFRQRYRNVDVLVLDDIHFIAGKESTQEEFFHTFNALYDAHKQIIISSDRPPKEIENLQDRLVSRFGWGLTTDIQPPDLETRVAILKKKIEREPVTVPDEVIFFIAQLIKTNIRELEGALIRVIAYALLEEKPITLVLAKEVLKDLLKEPKKLITVDFIQRCVAEEFGISLSDLKLKRRNKTIVLPRQIAMYLSRELTELSLPEIGQYFGGKDHTTVLHSYNKIKEQIQQREDLKAKVERIINIIQQ